MRHRIRLLSLICVLATAGVFLNTSKNLATMNQGDFFGVIDSLLNRQPLDVHPYGLFQRAAFLWSYSDLNQKPPGDRNTNWIYLWVNTKIQHLFNPYFDLALMALFSKLIVLWCCYRLAGDCLRLVRLPGILQALLFLLLLLPFACAHTAEFFNSFYGEQTFIVFLPVVLVGLFEPQRHVRIGVTTFGLLMTSAAKPQYFYFAALAALLYLSFEWIARRRFDPLFFTAATLAFCISTWFAFHASGNAANYYNSTYFGSYLLLSDQQLNELDVKPATRDCIGVDPWGNRVDRHDTLKLTQISTDCAGRTHMNFQGAVAPYWRFPDLLFRLWQLAAPAHFTIHYFHVYPAARYLVPSDGISFHTGRILIELSDWRERWITRYYWIYLAIGVMLPLIFPSLIPAQLRLTTLLLALFIPAQYATSLLGEGIRDLSKHLAAAQLCLDLLVIFLAIDIGALISAKLPGVTERHSR